MSDVIRAHVIMPRDLLAEVDKLVGSRRRSEFIVEAVRERMRQERQSRALREAPILDLAEHPEWVDSSKWVHDLRQADQRHIDEKLCGWGAQ